MAVRQYTAGIWHWHWPMDAYCMPSISICHSFPFCNVIVICHPYPLPCFNPPLSSPYHLNLLASLKTNHVLKTHPLSEAPSGSLPGQCQGRCPAQLCYAAPHFFDQSVLDCQSCSWLLLLCTHFFPFLSSLGTIRHLLDISSNWLQLAAHPHRLTLWHPLLSIMHGLHH